MAQKQKATKRAAPAAPATPVAPAPPAAPPSLSESLTGEAKAAYEGGKLLYGDGDYAGARVKFQAAFDASKDPRLLWNMAVCEKGLRHYAKVMQLTERYLELGGAMLSETDRSEAKDLLAAIESFTVSLSLVVNEASAEIFVDGEHVGTSPIAKPLVVDIGTREIGVEKPGFKPFRGSVPVGGQKQASFSVALVRELHEGQLSVTAPQAGVIFIDGKQLGRGRWTGKLGSGGHTLRVEAPGMRPYQSEVVIQDDEKRGVDVSLEPLAAAAPSAQKHGPLYDLEVGFRTGYGIAKTSAQGVNDTQTQNKSVAFIPLWFDVGFRPGRPTYLGLYGQFGWLDKSDTCGIARHGADPDDSADYERRYGYTSCKLLKVGVDVMFHLMPRTIIDPYFGFDVGLQATFAKYRSYDPVANTDGEGSDDNASFQPGFQLGVDVHPTQALGIGLFAQGGPNIGGEGKPNNQDENQPCTGSTPNCGSNDNCQNGSCESGGAHVGSHVVFGSRIAYTFP